MSYLNKMEYLIMPEGSYKVVRNCSKCGDKRRYINTNLFRVNANGNKVDVWLIYQCEKCRNTYNLRIYERMRPSDIAMEYNRFLENDMKLALEYGNNKKLFQKNKAEIDLASISYKITAKSSNEFNEVDVIIINNPYELKLRVDKVLCEMLSVTRNQIKQFIMSGRIVTYNNYLGRSTEIFLNNLIELVWLTSSDKDW